MRHIISFALSAVLAIWFVSCGKQIGPLNQEEQIFVSMQSEEEVSVDTILRDTCTIHLDTTFLYSIELGRKVHRFYDLFLGGHHLIAFSYDKGDVLPFDLRNMTCIDLYYDRYNDQRNFLDEGSFYPLYYYAHPNNRYLYIVTGIGANSNGWTTEYQLFKVDIKKLTSKFLLDCAAIAINEPYGFVVSRARLANRETATCTAEQIWAMHDEYIDYDGNVTRIDQVEYDAIELDARYREEDDDNYVKSFSKIIR